MQGRPSRSTRITCVVSAEEASAWMRDAMCTIVTGKTHVAGCRGRRRRNIRRLGTFLLAGIQGGDASSTRGPAIFPPWRERPDPPTRCCDPITRPNAARLRRGERAALAVVRSLGRAGYRVIVAAEHQPSLAGSSRHCNVTVLVPSALRDPAGFAQRVAALIQAHGIDGVIPIAEPSLLALSDHRSLLHGAAFPFPPADITRRVLDKQAVLAAAAHLGIAVPAQHTLTSRADLQALRESPPAMRWSSSPVGPSVKTMTGGRS